ncbi:MAG: replicative DNA helicase [Proteobacteria bacterium]|nr:MAG: replicative DNA helicase [Pseudomonadota bacterium]PIE17696.1 MAG: replicative DNA helicase [Pseudomonadota bacterium]
MAGGRPLPHSKEAETSVLGGILLNPKEALDQVVELLTVDDFYVPAHAEIYHSMLRLEELGNPIDIITLEEQLRSNDKLKLIGGVATLANLAARVSTVENIGYHAKIVRDKATLRTLIQEVSEVATQAYDDPDDVQTFLDGAEQKIFELSQRAISEGFTSIRDLLLKTFNSIEQRYERKEDVTGVPTGYPDLDEMTSGLQPSDLIIVAARPSMGKTAFCLNIAQNAAMQQNIPVLIFSLEMSKEALVERLLAAEARVESSKIRRGFLDQYDWMSLTRAASNLSSAPIWIDDTAAPSILEVRAKARRFRADRTIFSEDNQMGMVVVDYLQLARSHGRTQSREQEVAEISRGLKALAKEVQLPVIALSQLRRAAEDRKDGRPQLSDLRESGAIEQDADVIMFIHRPYEEGSSTRKSETELIIGKQRNGPVGVVELMFIGKYTRFESRAREG